MNTEEIRAFQKQIGTAAWKIDFYDFAERIGQSPQHAHTQTMWAAFTNLNKALNRFDAETLGKIVEGFEHPA